MANPQKENGYTPIANEIMEAVARLQINATQFRILVVVWRYTYGFSRKEHKLSESFIAKATEIHKKQIGRELAVLIKRNILIEVVPPSFSTTRVLAFNKNYLSWQSTKPLTGSETVDQTGSELVDSPGSELVDQDKQYIKQNIKQNAKSQNKFSDESLEIQLSKYLYQKILESDPKAREPNLQKWAEHMDKLMRIDGRTESEIRQVIDFCQDDNFWKSNILSANKLREKFSTLLIQKKSAAKEVISYGEAMI